MVISDQTSRHVRRGRSLAGAVHCAESWERALTEYVTEVGTVAAHELFRDVARADGHDPDEPSICSIGMTRA